MREIWLEFPEIEFHLGPQIDDTSTLHYWNGRVCLGSRESTRLASELGQAVWEPAPCGQVLGYDGRFYRTRTRIRGWDPATGTGRSVSVAGTVLGPPMVTSDGEIIVRTAQDLEVDTWLVLDPRGELLYGEHLETTWADKARNLLTSDGRIYVLDRPTGRIMQTDVSLQPLREFLRLEGEPTSWQIALGDFQRVPIPPTPLD